MKKNYNVSRMCISSKGKSLAHLNTLSTRKGKYRGTFMSKGKSRGTFEHFFYEQRKVSGYI